MDAETRQCQNCKQNFVIEPDDFAFYEKIKVPPPTWCPECRAQRREVFRNERTLHRRMCTFPGHTEEVLSIYAADNPLQVYDYQVWWSDEWDPMTYGRSYDLNRSFLEQWRELRDSFPLLALSNARAENSEYCNVNDKSKNCYLISASYENEGVMYSNRVSFNKDAVDCYIVHKSELCYEDVVCKNSYRLLWSRHSRNCSNSAFLCNCDNCSDCFGCVNLRNQKFHIFNQPYSKKEYLEKLNGEFDLGSYRGLRRAKEEFDKICASMLHRYAEVVSSVNSTGDNLYNCKNARYCFDMEVTEDSKYCFWGGFMLSDSYDAGPGVGDNADLFYESFDLINGSRLYFSSVVYNSHDVQYSFNCYSSSHLFGCVGLHNKQYCILNKQYTKEEYEVLVPKIIDHMNAMPYVDSKGRVYKYGEFFPPELSPFAYNETIAQEYFPLTKAEAESKGYRWRDPDPKGCQITMTHDRLPDHIKNVDDSILKETIGCAHAVISDNPRPDQRSSASCNHQCTTAFRIIPEELSFYRRMNLPLPRLCPNCRHYERLKQRNPLKLWHRQCQCAGKGSENGVYTNTIRHSHDNGHCPNEFETSYAPDRKEIVYCEQCYQSEVV